jgi:glucose-6-phosphate dehydrogenase assembly protein OpcA
VPAVSDSVWTARDTSPSEVEAALRNLIAERHGEDASFVPARVLNMVCIVDRRWCGEIVKRLEGVGRYHASRTVICAVEPRRRKIDATARLSDARAPEDGEFGVLLETVVIEIGPEHLPHLDTIVDPLVVTDLATVVWAPHHHEEAVDTLLGLAQVVLLDSVDEPDPAEALRRACELAKRVYVVDLAWLRSTPWRERVAAAFDPPARRKQLHQIARVTMRHHPDSGSAALLLCAWLASRLGWKATRLTARQGGFAGTLRARRAEVAVVLEPVNQETRGLAGITIEMADGSSLSLDRGAGGLRTARIDSDGKQSQWTIVGASRGEGGILGEGIRQALLRDPTYSPALTIAGELVG